MKVFIDGKEGTTGLQIYDRLSQRTDITLLTLDDEKRKDESARRDMLNKADIVFLCLPDDAAIQAVGMIENPSVKVIDASTAHRTNPEWAYGLPELSQKRRQKIASSLRVANPGCHATGFEIIVYPLIKSGILEKDYPFVATSLSGYSGAGKKGIAQYEDKNRDRKLCSPRHYALTQSHKHIPEIVNVCHLSQAPIFQPVICDFYAGMCVSVPLYANLLNKHYGVEDMRSFYKDFYAGQNFISVPEKDDVPSYIASNEIVGTNKLKIYISGNDERIFIASVFDNLGKGASGAAVQNMNIMLGLDETTYLV